MREVETLPVEDTDSDLARVRVTTVDAAKNRRVYEIGLSATEVMDDGYIMNGSRVDENAPAEPAGGGPSEAAWDAAAERLKEAGYEVHGR